MPEERREPTPEILLARRDASGPSRTEETPTLLRLCVCVCVCVCVFVGCVRACVGKRCMYLGVPAFASVCGGASGSSRTEETPTLLRLCCECIGWCVFEGVRVRACAYTCGRVFVCMREAANPARAIARSSENRKAKNMQYFLVSELLNILCDRKQWKSRVCFLWSTIPALLVGGELSEAIGVDVADLVELHLGELLGHGGGCEPNRCA